MMENEHKQLENWAEIWPTYLILCIYFQVFNMSKIVGQYKECNLAKEIEFRCIKYSYETSNFDSQKSVV